MLGTLHAQYENQYQYDNFVHEMLDWHQCGKWIDYHSRQELEIENKPRDIKERYWAIDVHTLQQLRLYIQPFKSN